MNIALYVRNIAPDKKVCDELVCNIDIVSSNWRSQVESQFPMSSKLVISDYTRDAPITTLQSTLQEELIKGRSTESILIFSCTAVTGSRSEDEKKLVGFLKYLVERKKIAVAQKSDGGKIYFMAVQLADSTLSLYAATQSKDQSRPDSKAPSSNPSSFIQLHNSQVNTAHAKQQAVQIKQPVQKPGPAAGSDNFFASIVNKMEATSKVLAKTKAPSPPPPVNVYEGLERETREKLAAFVTDPALTKLAFDPLPRDERAVIHDLVAEVDCLISWSEGDGEERHVVAYRKGHEPPGFVSHQQEKTILKGGKGLGGARKAGGGNKGVQDRDAMIVRDVEPVNIERVKRDRRTIEEIEESKKQKQKLEETV